MRVWSAEPTRPGGGPLTSQPAPVHARRRTTRVVEDLDEDRGLLLVGWCQLRDSERYFSLDGIVGVRPAE